MLTYEQQLWSKTYPYNVDSGAEFFGTEGEMFVSSRGKFRVLGPHNRRIEKTIGRSPREFDGGTKPTYNEHPQRMEENLLISESIGFLNGGRPNDAPKQ